MDILSAYNKLSTKPVFSRADVDPFVKARRTAYYLIETLVEQGLAVKIRNNLYTTVEKTTGKQRASQSQIACSLTDSAHLCRASALYYHGLLEPQGNACNVGSESRFTSFEFNSVRYQYVRPVIFIGVMDSPKEEGVRVTDLERTVLDYIRDFEKINSLSDLLQCLGSIGHLDEAKLWKYLAAYDFQFLYQKLGFLASSRQTALKLSNDFIDGCRGKVSKPVPSDGPFLPDLTVKQMTAKKASRWGSGGGTLSIPA